MVSGVERAFVGCDRAVLRAEWWPWAIASAIVLAAGISVCLLHSQGIVGARAISSSDIFFGTLAAGLVPRGIPGFVRLQLDMDGLTIQQVHKADRIRWLDIVGSFSVNHGRVGRGVTFVRRNSPKTTSPFSPGSRFTTNMDSALKNWGLLSIRGATDVSAAINPRKMIPNFSN